MLDTTILQTKHTENKSTFYVHIFIFPLSDTVRLFLAYHGHMILLNYINYTNLTIKTICSLQAVYYFCLIGYGCLPASY